MTDVLCRVQVYDRTISKARTIKVNVSVDTYAIAALLAQKAFSSKKRIATALDRNIVVAVIEDTPGFPTDRRVPVASDDSPTFGKARQMAQAAGKAAQDGEI